MLRSMPGLLSPLGCPMDLINIFYTLAATSSKCVWIKLTENLTFVLKCRLANFVGY